MGWTPPHFGILSARLKVRTTVNSEKGAHMTFIALGSTWPRTCFTFTAWIVMSNQSGGSVYLVIAGCKRCWTRSSLAVRSAWKVVAVRTIGRGSYRHADFR